MRKFLLFVIIALTSMGGIYIYSLCSIINEYKQNISLKDEAYYLHLKDSIVNSDNENADEDLYKVYVDNKFTASFDSYAEAVVYCGFFENAAIFDYYSSVWVWDNYPNFIVTSQGEETRFFNFHEAVDNAKKNGDSFIGYKDANVIIWDNLVIVNDSFHIDIPGILQKPELDRGCEVTSAAMLINYKGVDADKMTLAQEIVKADDNNPYKGFVGDIYTYKNWGLGVYHGPVYDLINTYLPYTAIDLTGGEFTDFYYLLNKEQPIWVITNNTYKPLSNASFETWKTDDGELKVTYKEHSVLVTGYDKNYIYFNDPLGSQSYAEKTNFIKAWEQMGRQAISTAK